MDFAVNDATTCHSGFQRYAKDTPINFSVKSSSETACKTNDSPKVMKETPKELLYEGHCEEHCLPNHFKCMNCNHYICGTCIYFFHKNCSKVLPVFEALNPMKKEEKLKKIKVFKTKLEKEAQMFDSNLNQLKRKQEKLYKEIINVIVEVKKNKSKKDRNQKIYKYSTCHEENLEKAISNEDYEKADAKASLFFERLGIDLYLSVLSKEDAMKITRKDLEENTFYVTKSDNGAMKYSKVMAEVDQISFGEWEEAAAERGSSCIDILDFIRSRTVVINTHKFIKEHKKELHSPRFPKDKIKFSQIEVSKEKEVYFNSFKTSNGSDFVFNFESLLKTLGCSSVVPAEAFLKIQMSSGEGEVVISTDGGSTRALNFLLLASGIMDDSYQMTLFLTIIFKDSCVDGGHNNHWSCFPGVVKGIQDGGIYKRNNLKRGDIEGHYASESNQLSYFCFWKKDSSHFSTRTFGRVERGMEVVDQITFNDSVIECGLLFNLS